MDFCAATEWDPSHVRAWVNRGYALDDLGRHEDALVAYDRALRLNPGLAEAHMNKAMILLARMDFAEGWRGYQQRFFTQKPAVSLDRIPFPYWDGTPVRKLLVVGEQGIGDQILHASLLHDVRAQVEHVTLSVDTRLVSIFQRAFPWANVLASAEVNEALEVDAFLPLASLGTLFRQDSSDFDRQPQGFLSADEGRIAEIKRALANINGPLMGLSWRSASQTLFRDKGIDLPRLVDGLAGLNGQYLNLQFAEMAGELSGFPSLITLPELDLFNDLEGVLAAIHQCDAVVTISNTTAHMAGAMGKPVFLLLPYAAGRLWYWHSREGRSLWYPSIRVFRQVRPGDWSEPLEGLRFALRGFFGP
jgi:hypothetical protein